MTSSLKSLCKVQLLQMFGINQLRYSKDHKKKNNFIILFVGNVAMTAMIIFYSYIIGMQLGGMGLYELIPAYVLVITTIVTLSFTFLKVNSVLFGGKDDSLLFSLPIRLEVIIASRFISMYIGNLFFTILVMVPSCWIYVSHVGPSISTLIMLGLSFFVIPLIPMTVACILGSLITMISVRVKYTNIINIILSFVMIIAIMAMCMNTQAIEQIDFNQVAVTFMAQLNSLYPIAFLYNAAILDGSFIAYSAFIVLSIGIFILFVVLVSKQYLNIISKLRTHKVKSNFRLTEMRTRTPFMALYKKEMKNYLASSTYVINTGVGYVFIVIIGIVVAMIGFDGILEQVGMLPAKELIYKIVPMILGALVSVSPTTSSAISIEGKYWWNTCSLPVESKVIYQSKIMVNMTIALVAVLFTGSIYAVTISATLIDKVLIFVVPISYALFSAISGLYVNIKKPYFTWKNETVVVKQSSAVLISMCINFVTIAVPVVLLFALKGEGISLIFTGVSVVLLLAAGVIYNKITKIPCQSIKE